jgi:catechol 2,3-dioxygenase-like lactoylglutathione lyase family enzyme
MVLTAFDHATIVVHDVGHAVRRYERLLGRAPSWRGWHVGLGTEGALFGLSNAMIELVGPRVGANEGADDEAEGLRAHLRERGEGLQAMAFLAAEAMAVREALRARGVRATEPQPGEARSDDGSVRHYQTVDLSPRATRGLSVLVVERQVGKDLRSPDADSAGAVDALDHVVVRSADPSAAEALYGAALGIRLALDRRIGDRRMLFYRIGGVTIEVVEDPTRGPSDGFGGLAYRVADIDSANARLRGGGFDVSDVRDGAKPGTRVFTVRDGTCSVPTLVVRDPSRDASAPRGA